MAQKLLTSIVDTGEKLYHSTGTDGQEEIQQCINILQKAFEDFSDHLGTAAREADDYLSRWVEIINTLLAISIP